TTLPWAWRGHSTSTSASHRGCARSRPGCSSRGGGSRSTTTLVRRVMSLATRRGASWARAGPPPTTGPAPAPPPPPPPPPAPLPRDARPRRGIPGEDLVDLAQVRELSDRLLDEVEKAVVGKREALELVLLGFLADGHVLLEDYPGLAKTLAARSFAQVLSLRFTRIQFTPDLMPSDVTGSPIWNQRD